MGFGGLCYRGSRKSNQSNLGALDALIGPFPGASVARGIARGAGRIVRTEIIGSAFVATSSGVSRVTLALAASSPASTSLKIVSFHDEISEARCIYTSVCISPQYRGFHRSHLTFSV